MQHVAHAARVSNFMGVALRYKCRTGMGAFAHLPNANTIMGYHRVTNDKRKLKGERRGALHPSSTEMAHRVGCKVTRRK